VHQLFGLAQVTSSNASQNYPQRCGDATVYQIGNSSAHHRASLGCSLPQSALAFAYTPTEERWGASADAEGTAQRFADLRCIDGGIASLFLAEMALLLAAAS
jgi:hypothetical protein